LRESWKSGTETVVLGKCSGVLEKLISAEPAAMNCIAADLLAEPACLEDGCEVATSLAEITNPDSGALGIERDLNLDNG
jgi:hypothetical protein